MGFEFNWVEALAVFVCVYSALVFERVFRRYRARKSWRPSFFPPASAMRRKSMTKGVAEPIICGGCSREANDFVEYTDGDKWCLACDAAGED